MASAPSATGLLATSKPTEYVIPDPAMMAKLFKMMGEKSMTTSLVEKPKPAFARKEFNRVLRRLKFQQECLPTVQTAEELEACVDNIVKWSLQIAGMAKKVIA